MVARLKLKEDADRDEGTPLGPEGLPAPLGPVVPGAPGS